MRVSRGIGVLKEFVDRRIQRKYKIFVWHIKIHYKVRALNRK